jgi:hypothetical protein
MHLRYKHIGIVIAAITIASSGFTQEAATTATSQQSDEQTSPSAVPCIDLPTGNLTDAQLKQLVPDELPGRVFIKWRTETQEDNYGFNIYRSKSANGPYAKINRGIIPGEGSTNIPRDYCYMDTGLPRGAIFYYQIESVSNSGMAELVEGTKATRVKVKSVQEEREWLRKKAAGIETRPAARPSTEPETSDRKASTTSATEPSNNVTKQADQTPNPLE